MSIKEFDETDITMLLADKSKKIKTVFKSFNDVKIDSNVPMTAPHYIFNDTLLTDNSGKEFIIPTADKTEGGTFSFNILFNENTMFDLSEYEFQINAFSYYIMTSDGTLKDEMPQNVNNIKFANQPLLSLFNQFSLVIDGVVVETVGYASLNANMTYALKHNHSTEQERINENYGYSLTDYLSVDDDNSFIFDTNEAIKYDVINDVNDSSVYYKYIPVNITQNLRLSDIFGIVDSLPCWWNHDIKVIVKRANTSFIGVDCMNEDIRLSLNAFQRFVLVGKNYVVSDKVKNVLNKYYSKPVETLIRTRNEKLIAIPSQPSENMDISFSIGLPVCYRSSLLVFAIPRTTNAQALNHIYSYADTIGDDDTMNDLIYWSEAGKNYNDYITTPFAQAIISTNSGMIIKSFTMDNDGFTENQYIKLLSPWSGLDTNSDYKNARIYNYLEVYKAYLEAREHFGECKDEAIPYLDFMKDYLIFCVDLSNFKLNAKTKLNITLKTANYQNGFNPFFKYNRTDINGDLQDYISNSILFNMYSQQVLKISKNSIQIHELFDTEPENLNEV